MNENNQIIRAEGSVLWHQIVRDKNDEPIKNRDVQVRADAYRTVEEFADFCKAEGGDLYASVGVAMNEINAQSRELLNKVYLAEREDEIKNYEPLLDTCVTLFRALDR